MYNKCEWRDNVYFEIDRIKRILKELNSGIFTQRIQVEDVRMKPCGYGEYKVLDEDSTQWQKFNKGDSWGGKDKHFGIKLNLTIPSEFEGKKSYV